jgi:hypothetical protein
MEILDRTDAACESMAAVFGFAHDSSAAAIGRLAIVACLLCTWNVRAVPCAVLDCCLIPEPPLVASGFIGRGKSLLDRSCDSRLDIQSRVKWHRRLCTARNHCHFHAGKFLHGCCDLHSDNIVNKTLKDIIANRAKSSVLTFGVPFLPCFALYLCEKTSLPGTSILSILFILSKTFPCSSACAPDLKLQPITNF